MYLNFVYDLIEVGTKAVVNCNDSIVEGIVVKINKDIIAIQQADGSIILKHDRDVTNIEVISKHVPTKEQEILNNSDIKLDKRKARCGMILIKSDKLDTFHCKICGKEKTSKKYAIEVNDPGARICNACYGWTLSIFEK